MAEGRDARSWRRYLDEEYVSRNLGRIDAERRIVFQNLKNIAKTEKEIDALAIAAGRTDTEKLAFTLFPWLLASGLALRTGRVSAGLRGLY